LLIASLLLAAAASAAIARPPANLIGNLDMQGHFEVYLPGAKVPKGIAAKPVCDALGQQVPNPAVPKCKAAAALVNIDSRGGRPGTVILCSGSPNIGRIYNGAYFDARPGDSGGITIKDEAALQRAIGWPTR
jgi:hypothetical protein